MNIPTRRSLDETRNGKIENTIYTIKIEGVIGQKWTQWLGDMTIINLHQSPENTILEVTIPDQSALRGIINKLWDLNLTIISVQRQLNRIRIGGNDVH